MRAGGGSERAFEALYTAHYQAMAGYVRRRVAAHEADDVIAQIFAVAWRRFATFRHRRATGRGCSAWPATSSRTSGARNGAGSTCRPGCPRTP